MKALSTGLSGSRTAWISAIRTEFARFQLFHGWGSLGKFPRVLYDLYLGLHPAVAWRLKMRNIKKRQPDERQRVNLEENNSLIRILLDFQFTLDFGLAKAMLDVHQSCEVSSAWIVERQFFTLAFKDSRW